MKIRFRQSGGVAKVELGCDLDTDLLIPDEAKKLRALVEECGCFKAKRWSIPWLENLMRGNSSVACDLFFYEINVKTTKRTRRVSFNDLSRPEGIEPLLHYLQIQAKPLSRW
jgi:hypothetical protein